MTDSEFKSKVRDCRLIEDGTSDQVISYKGKEYKFNLGIGLMDFRNEDGTLTERRFNALCYEVIEQHDFS